MIFILSLRFFSLIIFITCIFYNSQLEASEKELSARAKPLDLNKNGTIEESEAKGPIKDNFKEIDKNKDDRLDGLEITEFFRKKYGGSGGSENQSDTGKSSESDSPKSAELSGRAKALDKNNNGFIDLSEAVGPLKSNFEAIDKDNSGGIDGNELRLFFTGGGPGATVVTDKVTNSLKSQIVPVIGKINSFQSGIISSLISSSVKKVYVSPGDRVKKGELLLKLNDTLFTIERNKQLAIVDQRQALVEIAYADLEKIILEKRRIEKLKSSSVYSKKREDDIGQDLIIKEGFLRDRNAQLNQAVEMLSKSKVDLENTNIIAPYEGVIFEKHVEKGTFINKGNKVFSIVNDKKIEISTEVPNIYIPMLEIGMEVNFSTNNNQLYKSNIKSILPIEDPLTGTRKVLLSASFNEFKEVFAINQNVNVKIPTSSKSKVVTVHKDAVISKQDKHIVFLVKGNIAREIVVTLGRSVGNRFVVKNGLSKNDIVVIRGNESLRNNQKVKIKR